jgi:hypothetical protein
LPMHRAQLSLSVFFTATDSSGARNASAPSGDYARNLVLDNRSPLSARP